jgi:hypothetical protein
MLKVGEMSTGIELDLQKKQVSLSVALVAGAKYFTDQRNNA